MYNALAPSEISTGISRGVHGPLATQVLISAFISEEQLHEADLVWGAAFLFYSLLSFPDAVCGVSACLFTVHAVLL